MIYRIAKLLSTIVAAMLLIACAAPVPKIDLAPNAMTNIKTIGIILPPEPKIYAVANFGHGGMAFGLIGGLIAAADQNSKQEQLAKVYKEYGVSVCSELSKKISDRLSSLGFNTRIEEASWEEVNGGHTLPFKKINSDSDAVLVVSPTTIGFVATGLTDGYSNDYLPTIASVVIMLGKDRENPIYRGYHVTGWNIKAEGWKHTPPENRFSNFDALYLDPKTSSTSLTDAAEKIAHSIALDIKQQQGITKALLGKASTEGQK